MPFSKQKRQRIYTDFHGYNFVETDLEMVPLRLSGRSLRPLRLKALDFRLECKVRVNPQPPVFPLPSAHPPHKLPPGVSLHV
jgi:hypothetical protein